MFNVLTPMFKSVSVEEFNYHVILEKDKVYIFEIVILDTCNIITLYLSYLRHISLSDLN